MSLSPVFSGTPELHWNIIIDSFNLTQIKKKTWIFKEAKPYKNIINSKLIQTHNSVVLFIFPGSSFMLIGGFISLAF